MILEQFQNFQTTICFVFGPITSITSSKPRVAAEKPHPLLGRVFLIDAAAAAKRWACLSESQCPRTPVNLGPQLSLFFYNLQHFVYLDILYHNELQNKLGKKCFRKLPHWINRDNLSWKLKYTSRNEQCKWYINPLYILFRVRMRRPWFLF